MDVCERHERLRYNWRGRPVAPEAMPGKHADEVVAPDELPRRLLHDAVAHN